MIKIYLSFNKTVICTMPPFPSLQKLLKMRSFSSVVFSCCGEVFGSVLHDTSMFKRAGRA